MSSKLILIPLLIAPPLIAEDAETLFVRRVWPLFQEKCLACHGNDEHKIKGGLDMRTRATTLKGGESGQAALVPGKADQSPLYLATTRKHDDWEPMPPKEADKIYAEQTTWIKDWITFGATWPEEARRKEIAKLNAEKWSTEDGITVNTTGALSSEWAGRRYKPENLWAYQPVKKVHISNQQSENPIDELIAMRMPPDMKPAPPADARTFIRRATYDLTGLPPTPEQVTAFEADTIRDPEAAIRDLIHRLLESPHYGERMARHWLDVARYADTSGFANDFERGNAWRYRDYVVRSFNNDKPYDQFVREQVAGDEIRPRTPEKLIATGFLRMGPWELTGMEVAKIARQRFLDDVTNSVGETFLAHSLQCARCHDHKFDPIPTHDYYAMQACFSTTQLAERPAVFLKEENTAGFEERQHLETRFADHLAVLQRLDDKELANGDKWFAENKLDRTAWDMALEKARTMASSGKSSGPRTRNFFAISEAARSIMRKQGVPEDQYPPKNVGFESADFGGERVARKGLERLRWEMERYEPFAFSVYNGRTPQMTAVYQPLRMPDDRMTNGELEQTAILGGGDPFSPTKPVLPNGLSVLSETANLKCEIPDAIEGRRSALADWIASKDNPLTTRAIANRLWLWHFGQALAGNPNNFGGTGKKPTHPELLDWLAATLVEKNWSLKEMHRIIMMSAAYRRTSFPTRSGETELENSVYATFKPRRLSAEEVRDTMLSITGELNPTLGGIPNRPEINIEVAMQPRQVMGTFAAAWVPNALPQQRHRRSLYALKIRGVRDPFMEVFNEPAPDFSCEAREVSTVTPQVFSLFNGLASHDRALALANRVLKEKATDPIARIFALAYGRQPTADEKAACEAHWQQMEKTQTTLTFTKPNPPLEIRRDAVEENTGEKFSFNEKLPGYAEFVPDLQPADCDARTRALADVCLVLLNSNEFAYLY